MGTFTGQPEIHVMKVFFFSQSRKLENNIVPTCKLVSQVTWVGQEGILKHSIQNVLVVAYFNGHL